ncbi:hypothetical protein [Bacteroides graminisolvens]
MKKYILIFWILLPCCSAKIENHNPKTNKVYEIFQVISGKMQAHNDYMEKNRLFEELIGHTMHFFKVVNTVAPQFLTDTKLYKDDILNLLTDKSFKRYDLIDYDIPYLLYNLHIDDYVDLLYSVVPLFKNGDIDQEIFERFIFPDDFVSTSLYQNYQNEKLQLFLNNLLKDQDLISKVKILKPYQLSSFSERIYRLKNGTMWEGDNEHSGFKKMYANGAAILDGLKAKMGY